MEICGEFKVKDKIYIVAMIMLLFLSGCGSNEGEKDKEKDSEIRIEEKKDLEMEKIDHIEAKPNEFKYFKNGLEINDKDKSFFIVNVYYKDGTMDKVEGWSIKEPKTLKTSETVTITIEYKGKKVDVSVECDDLTPEDYRSKCEYVSWDDLMRNENDYIGKKIYIVGQVTQEISLNQYKINLLDNWDSEFVVSNPPHYSEQYNINDTPEVFLENDIVTVYGEFMGTDRFTNVLGAERRLPTITAKYIDRN